MKVSAVAPEHRVVEAKARVFNDQEAVRTAFRNGEFTEDTVVVVRFQGPRSNGMPELHSLTPILSVLLGLGADLLLVVAGPRRRTPATHPDHQGVDGRRRQDS